MLGNDNSSCITTMGPGHLRACIGGTLIARVFQTRVTFRTSAALGTSSAHFLLHRTSHQSFSRSSRLHGRREAGARAVARRCDPIPSLRGTGPETRVGASVQAGLLASGQRAPVQLGKPPISCGTYASARLADGLLRAQGRRAQLGLRWPASYSPLSPCSLPAALRHSRYRLQRPGRRPAPQPCQPSRPS
jgi:hypothetical protein